MAWAPWRTISPTCPCPLRRADPAKGRRPTTCATFASTKDTTSKTVLRWASRPLGVHRAQLHRQQRNLEQLGGGGRPWDPDVKHSWKYHKDVAFLLQGWVSHHRGTLLPEYRCQATTGPCPIILAAARRPTLIGVGAHSYYFSTVKRIPLHIFCLTCVSLQVFNEQQMPDRITEHGLNERWQVSELCMAIKEILLLLYLQLRASTDHVQREMSDVC